MAAKVGRNASKVIGVTVALQGDPSLSRASVSMKSMIKVLKAQGEGVLLELGSIMVQNNSDNADPPAQVKEVLKEFQHVFEMPNCIPSSRKHDHAINLQPEATLVSVRPCQYPHF